MCFRSLDNGRRCARRNVAFCSKTVCLPPAVPRRRVKSHKNNMEKGRNNIGVCNWGWAVGVGWRPAETPPEWPCQTLPPPRARKINQLFKNFLQFLSIKRQNVLKNCQNFPKIAYFWSNFLL